MRKILQHHPYYYSYYCHHYYHCYYGVGFSNISPIFCQPPWPAAGNGPHNHRRLDTSLTEYVLVLISLPFPIHALYRIHELVRGLQAYPAYQIPLNRISKTSRIPTCRPFIIPITTEYARTISSFREHRVAELPDQDTSCRAEGEVNNYGAIVIWKRQYKVTTKRDVAVFGASNLGIILKTAI